MSVIYPWFRLVVPYNSAGLARKADVVYIELTFFGGLMMGYKQTWTVAEAKARLSEPRKPMGQWLVDNMPRGADLEFPDRDESEREIPFISEAT